MEAEISQATRQHKKTIQPLQVIAFWPIAAAFVLAGVLAWFSLKATVAFYAWHRILSLALVVAVCASLAMYLTTWRKPDPFSMSSEKILLRQARRYWLSVLLIHLSLAACFHLIFWGILWLVGPRVWLLLFVVLIQTISLVGLLGFWFKKMPHSLVLCWNSPTSQTFSWEGWRREFFLSSRHAATVRADLAKPEPEMLSIVRILEQGASKGRSVGHHEWKKPEWVDASLSRLRASAFMSGMVFPIILLVMLILLGGLRFASFPPGFLSDQNYLKIAMNKKDVEQVQAGAAAAAQSKSPSGGDEAAQGGDSENSADNTGPDAEQGGGEGTSGDAGQTGDAASDQEDAGENELPPDQNYGNEEVIDDDRRDEESPEQASDPANDAEEARGIPNPLNLPGLKPGDAAGDQPKEGRGPAKPGQSSEEKPGEGRGKQPAPGEGEMGSQAAQTKAGAGAGKGEGELGQDSQERQDENGSNASSQSGSKKGPREIEYGGGGGPQEGKPGPPSPPDPDVQELIKIELPPVEAGRLKRKALAEEAKQAKRKAETVDLQAAGARDGKVVGKGEAEQTLPNWILLMLKQKQKRNGDP